MAINRDVVKSDGKALTVDEEVLKDNEKAIKDNEKRNEEAIMGHKRRYRATEGLIMWERGIMEPWRGTKARQ